MQNFKTLPHLCIVLLDTLYKCLKSCVLSWYYGHAYGKSYMLMCFVLPLNALTTSGSEGMHPERFRPSKITFSREWNCLPHLHIWLARKRHSGKGRRDLTLAQMKPCAHSEIENRSCVNIQAHTSWFYFSTKMLFFRNCIIVYGHYRQQLIHGSVLFSLN